MAAFQFCFMALAVDIDRCDLVTKCVASNSQKRPRQGCISRLYSSKRLSSITNKMERFSFKSGCVVQVENDEMHHQL